MAQRRTARRRGSLRSILRAGAVGLACLALAACATVTRNHGYVPTDEDLAQIEVGRDTRETAAPKIGRPSTQGLLSEDGWYYVQSRWEHRGAMPPREVDRQVVAVSFDSRGVVANVERFGLERGQVVALSRRVTEPNIRGRSALAQIFGNLGRISADQIIDN
jgi:outer membrane protein assembly factor BamE (lipoprotein component of BamABCDE complex)